MSAPDWGEGGLAYERLPERFNIVSLLVDRHLEEGRGARPAILTPERAISYAELAGSVARAAGLFTELGLQREQRVLLLMPDSPEFVFAFLGAMKAGLVPVPVPTVGRPDDLGYALEDSRAVAVVASAALHDRLDRLPARVPTLRHRLVVGGTPPGAIGFEAGLAAAADRFEAAPTHRDDMAYWLYSSGTTGRPKAVVHLHHDMLFCVDAYVRHVLAMTADDRTFSVPRLFFSYGLTSCLYLPLWCGASTVLVAARPDPAAMLALIARLRPTLLFSVPTSFAAIIRVLAAAEAGAPSRDGAAAATGRVLAAAESGAPSRDGAAAATGRVLAAAESGAPSRDGAAAATGRVLAAAESGAQLASLRLAVSAGEPLPAPLYHEWVTRTGVECLDGLGATEVGYIYLSNRPGAVRPGAAGQLLPGYRARLTDEQGREVPAGEIGELWVSGESVAAGYWNKHDRTKAAFVGEWYRSGDRCRVDAEGYYFFQGRADDLLRVSGHWVSPLEVESCLLEHPAVAECAVVGWKDDGGLVRPRAFVVLRPANPVQGLEDTLRAHLRDRLASFEAPRWITFVDDLPRTATGKLQRYRLRQE